MKFTITKQTTTIIQLESEDANRAIEDTREGKGKIVAHTENWSSREFRLQTPQIGPSARSPTRLTPPSRK